MTWRPLTLRSLVVAAVVALIAPAMWFVVTGETRRTPVIARSVSDKMTEQERAAWIAEHAKPVYLWEHAKNTPEFIVENWRGYLQASIVIFLVVLVINSAFLAGGRR
jgi:hypothetical protein